ncbi:MAG: NAD(P)H-dependent oxidoreductase [Bacteroidota bacterium]
MKQLLIINGHPDKESFNYALSDAYQEGATQVNTAVESINIADLKFNPNLQFGYRKRMELEPDLVEALDKIKRADHIVWVFPMWWYGLPAMMKGFIDRVFLPGISFQYVEGKPFPKQLLKGKTARVIITADAPKWYNDWYMRRPLINQFKRGVLEFCGIRPVKVTYLAPVKSSNLAIRNKWLEKVRQLGRQLS